MKTNAARLLDEAGIHYELREYEVGPQDLRAETVAGKIGLPVEQVFKTLVVRGERIGVCLAVIPGDTELDLKVLAKLAGDRKFDPPSPWRRADIPLVADFVNGRGRRGRTGARRRQPGL